MAKIRHIKSRWEKQKIKSMARQNRAKKRLRKRKSAGNK